MSADKLYTSDMLAAAVSLAAFPPLPDAGRHAEARSQTCGSTLQMDVDHDAEGRIRSIGMKVNACAVGQASAAIFAKHAGGFGLEELFRVKSALEAWLGGEGELPDWPEIELVAAAKDYPARHGAMLLSWNAAISALSSTEPSG
ncbi:iron-sulfur cluster assembly scaffold protein [Aurantiacibacter sp. D1-12]|uniref:iron-sulfur cluster assembly scaffold protein n=1 Tax=Aurantiacibacter sp. D1-12 TaxID=2993658 RepID=UPI00237CF9E8|nr:iron-sulfur cluster assembly scaffold protein [Aurantiacibacter sp. D1-12]MDE1466731.1 iron-sulfur cluster assembly scaffold protein [Aurantiacibacter sp. D1-12]